MKKSTDNICRYGADGKVSKTPVGTPAAPKEMRGMAMALRLTGNRVGLLLSPVLASGVVSAWGLPAYFYWRRQTRKLGAVEMGSRN